jgi:hypothetical protein
MPERRPIDIIRNSGGQMNVGPLGSESPITSMCEIGGCLCAVKIDGIYEIKLPDQVDPGRTNIALQKSQRRILAYGSDSEIVVRTLLTADVLFNPSYLGSAFDKKVAVDVTFSALGDLISMDEIANGLESVMAGAVPPTSQDGTLLVPSVADLVARCETFIQKARHAYLDLLRIAQLFYGDLGNKQVDRLSELARERHGDGAGLVRLLDSVGPFLHFVRRTRHCVEHPKEDQRIVVQDFQLSADGIIIPPTIEVIDNEKPYPRTAVLEFTKGVTNRLSKIFEIMIAPLCAHNMQAPAGLPIVVMELTVAERPASRVRFSFGVQNGDRQVPMK